MNYTKQEDANGVDIVERHESFGVAAITVSAGRTKLFGSAVRYSPNSVTLRIDGAKRVFNRGTLDEYVRPDKDRRLVEVSFTRYQWAELLSGFNGTPVPCTVNRVGGEVMEPVPDEVLTPLEMVEEQAKRTIEAVMSKAGENKDSEFERAITNALDAAHQLGLSKTRLDTITRAIAGIRRSVEQPKRTAEWAVTMLAEKTEEFITAAKIEIAASMDDTIRRAGLRVINVGDRDIDRAVAGMIGYRDVPMHREEKDDE